MESLILHPEVRALLDRYETEPTHVLHVAKLAEQLAGLDLLTPPLDDLERRELEIAALLHDIGWSVVPADGRGHHKESARLIREFAWTSLSAEAVARVALTARYHRKALPGDAHEPFMNLPPPDRERVRRMSALLRVADALDRRHIQRVDQVSLLRLENELSVLVHSTDEVGAECLAAEKKGDLLREVVGGAVRVVAEG